jgi:NAD(P)-dependent dehydrogenase (short-subunit alcohol dehydrogenase family)
MTAANVPTKSGTKAPLELEEELMKCFKINVVSNIHLFNLHLPLILKGQVKKVIAMSTGQADIEVINKFELDVAALYAISKAALNMAISKFNAQYKKDGVLFMSICPGMVETGHYADGMYRSCTRRNDATDRDVSL